MDKIVSQLNDEGFYVAPVVADESPLEPGVFLIPGGAVDLEPPKTQAGKRYRVSNGTWVEENIPPAPELVEENASSPEDQRRQSIRERLSVIDAQVSRPLREIVIALTAKKPVSDIALNKLSALETEAQELRDELSQLTKN